MLNVIKPISCALIDWGTEFWVSKGGCCESQKYAGEFCYDSSDCHFSAVKGLHLNTNVGM